jgi:magnesium-transporting ATPase (P-type)
LSIQIFHKKRKKIKRERKKEKKMMNKNTVLGWATFIMIFFGVVLISLGVFKYNEIAGWGFVSVGLGFFANAWVFNALKGRV